MPSFKKPKKDEKKEEDTEPSKEQLDGAYEGSWDYSQTPPAENYPQYQVAGKFGATLIVCVRVCHDTARLVLMYALTTARLPGPSAYPNHSANS